jgi:hypothetical protein
LAECIPGSPELLSSEELHERAWKLVYPRFAKYRQEVIAQYQQLAGTGRTSRELREIVPAAAHGRVEKLIVAAGVQACGTYLAEGDVVEMADNATAESIDLLDLAAIHTVMNGGMVYEVEPGKLPENAPAVAVYRY